MTAIPVSAFYQEGDARAYVRFCFAKQDAVLDEAVARLAGFFERRGVEEPQMSDAR